MASVVFLPLTLLSSIYGMNVELPYGADEHAFAFLGAGMFGLAVLMIGFFKWRRWF